MPSIKPMLNKLVTASHVSERDAEALVAAHRAGATLKPADATRLKETLVRAKDKFDAGATATLERFLEGVLAAGGFAGSMTLELMGAAASGVAGTGVIRGPVPASVKGIQATAGVVKLDPNADRAQVYAAFKTAITNIDGYAFLSKPPEGKTANEHTVLVKPGVNWGIAGYPSATSGESTYASVRLAFEEAQRRGATMRVVVGDQSGAENKLWGGTTLKNFENVGVLDGAVRAGLERAAALEAQGDRGFTGAGALARKFENGKIMLSDEDAIAMAKRAGVEVMGFEDQPHVRVPVPGAQHFKDGVLIPKLVRDEVTDIVNLPKPPGRHVLMGCTGLTGAMKNHVGLLGASDRIPALHGPTDRYPTLGVSGADGDTFLDRFKHLVDRVGDGDSKAVLRELHKDAKWDLASAAPGLGFQEKLVELYLAVKDKERFSVTDMRKTMSSMGPDLGDTVDIGLVLAAKDPTTVDVLGSAALKARYEEMGPETLLPGGDTFSEYLAGRTFLKNDASAFDLFETRAAMAYGVAPLGREAIDLKTAGSGLSDAELQALLARVTTPK